MNFMRWSSLSGVRFINRSNLASAISHVRDDHLSLNKYRSTVLAATAANGVGIRSPMEAPTEK